MLAVSESSIRPTKLKRLRLKPQVLELRKQGHTFEEIAKTVGISIGSVWNWCQDMK